MYACIFWFYYVRFKIKINIEKLIGFYWKYNESNVSQYIAIQWKNIAIYRNTFFLYRDTPIDHWPWKTVNASKLSWV